MDEFQEIAEIDPGLTKLLRSVFQEQPEVAHIYLGSKRHLMERIFNDANEPFWRSAKRVELGPIEPGAFRPFIQAGFRDNGRDIADDVVDRVLADHRRPPVRDPGALLLPLGRDAGAPRRSRRPVRRRAGEAPALRALAPQRPVGPRHRQPAAPAAALADEPGRPLSEDYRARHSLRGASTTQKAIDAAGQAGDRHQGCRLRRIAEPFYAEWIRQA